MAAARSAMLDRDWIDCIPRPTAGLPAEYWLAGAGAVMVLIAAVGAGAAATQGVTGAEVAVLFFVATAVRSGLVGVALPGASPAPSGLDSGFLSQMLLEGALRWLPGLGSGGGGCGFGSPWEFCV